MGSTTGILARFPMRNSLDYGTAYVEISNREIGTDENLE